MSTTNENGAGIAINDKLEPIAIVGMSCRFPGDADTPQGFWDLLSQGKDAWSEVPKDRFNIDAYYHPSSDREGAIITRSGFFLKQDPSKYDASFFSMTPAEAAGTDPQQRMLLEVTYEALENAGIPMKNIAGTRTSCYVGAFNKDYTVTCTGQIWDTPLYQATGNGMSMLSNRLSWFFDFRGASMTIDTACSSSLVALHLAVQGLRNREADVAVVGGTNLILQPEPMRGLSALHFLSPDGRCHSFDSSANGYARGDGVGILVLKPLCDALRDNDTIRAVIRGSGLNQDGKTPGITMPSRDMQAELINTTYAAAGLGLDRTSYFEAHGTGTAIGDPIELSAIGNSLGAARNSDNPIYVGSVKANLGHLEASAGVAGVIKAVLALENGMIPKIVGLENVNPRLELDEWRLKLNKSLIPWPNAGLRRASVNSFGYGGANAHLILDDAKHYLEEHGLRGNHVTITESSEESLDSDSDSGISTGTPPSSTSTTPLKPVVSCPKLFVLSSPEQGGPSRLGGTYAKYIEAKITQPESNDLIPAEMKAAQEAAYIEDLAYTLTERRTAFDWRSFVVARNTAELLTAIKQGLPKLRRAARTPACAFVFTGQGSQYFNMGRELQVHPIFRESLIQADKYISSLGSSWSVLEELNKSEEKSRINEAELSQPICTVLQVAIVNLLKHWGVSPKAVVGHSSGEIAAAYAAGMLTEQDAWKIAYFRGTCSGSLPTKYPELIGTMMAVALSESAAHEYTTRAETGKVVVACINSPLSVTLSGDESAINEIETFLKADEVWCRKLKVQTAYHSHHMKAISEAYLQSITDIKPLDSQSSTTMFSSVTGNIIAAAQLGPSYWVENMLSPVRFSSAVAALLAPADAKSRRQKLPNVQSLVEIGPHGVLKGPLNQIITACPEGYDKTVVYMSVLHRGNDAFYTAVETAGKLWGQGHDLNMRNVNNTTETQKARKVLTDLPPYPWNHERSHWHEARQTAFRRLQPGPRTDLIGFACDGFHPLIPDPRWTNFIKPTAMPWVLDHVISGLTVLPGAAMLCMAIEGCQQIVDPSKTVEGFEFRDINFTRALSFQSPDQQIETAMQFRPHTLGTKASTFVWHKFTLTSIASDNATTAHCNGLVRIKYVEKTSEIENGNESAVERKNYKDGYEAVYSKSTKEVNVPAMYNDIISQGMQMGPLFRLLSDMRGGVDVGCASITIPDTASVMPENYEYPLLIHPTVLDAVFGVLFSRAALDCNTGGTLSVISSIGSLYVDKSIPNEPGTVLRAYQTSNKSGWRDVVGDIVVSDADFTKPLVVVKKVVSTALATEGAEKNTADASMLCTHLEWKQDVSSLSSGAEGILESNSTLHEIDLQKNADVLEQSALIYMQRAVGVLDAEVSSSSSSLKSKEWAREILKGLPSLTLSKELENVVLAASAESSSVGKVLETIGSKLADVMSGTVDTRELLIEEGLGDLAVFTDKVLGLELINAMMVAWFDTAGNKNPDLQVLEIGNGSVSTAISILTALSGKNRAGPRYGQYTFTESDPSRLEDIKTLLKKFPNVDVRTLDIEQDLAKQDFKAEKYDVIVINDMLRTVSSIDPALKNAKRLLKPGGKLVIGALSKLTCRTALILGLTEGWWTASADENHQPHYLEEAEWMKRLRSNGLSLDIYLKDSTIEVVQQMSLIVSTLPKEAVKESFEVVIIEPLEARSSTIVLASNIQQHLVTRGSTVTRVTLETIPEPADKIFISLLELDSALLDAISEDAYNRVKALTTKSSGVLWITRGDLKDGLSLPSQSATIGLFRTLRSEVPHLQLFNLDLSFSLDLTSERATNLIVSLFDTSFSEEEDVVIDHEFAEANGTLFIPRLVQDEAMNASLTEKDDGPQPELKPLFQPGRPLKMELGEPGLLDTFRFVDRPEYKLPLPANRVDIEIVATGLNFVDVMTALGYIPSTKLGAEFAGRVTAIGNLVPEGMFHVGQMVVGLTEECFATNTRVHWKTVVPVPDGMSPEAAATCVIAYTTAYFALFDNGRLKKGDTILIHSAAGGLGQAAVQLAQFAGAIVYATVGSVHKKELLMEKYAIPENHIFNSRDTTFAKGLMRETNGRGVDVILNSTFGEMLRESWNCLADFGIFVEVGKRDILSNNSLEMLPFIRGCTFSAFNLAQYTEDSEQHRLDACFEVVKKVFKLLGEGHVKPPDPLHIMSITEAEKAFRALQSGRFAGKIVLMMKQDDIVRVMPEKQLPPELDSNATYLLAGGLGGIGKSLTELMVTLGARHFAFISRSGDSKEESKAFLAKLKEDGIQAKAYASDITDREALENTLQQCATEMPRIKGFVHCAMLLKDTIFETMSYNDWVAATGPKIQGSWNMHELLPQDLDFFVMLSSTSGIIGNPGQANYAAGNTFQNGLAHYRHRKGLKATSIDLSAVADVGYLAKNAEAYNNRSSLKDMQIKESEIHHIFLAAVTGMVKDKPLPAQLTTGIIGGEVIRSLALSQSFARDSKFILLRKADGQSGSSTGTLDPTRESFTSSESLAEAIGVVEMALVGRLAKALFISPEDINVEQPLHAYGVDSLTAVEVRNWVMKELRSDISILDILSPLPIHGLSTKIAEGSKILPAKLRIEISEEKGDGAMGEDGAKASVAIVKNGGDVENGGGLQRGKTTTISTNVKVEGGQSGVPVSDPVVEVNVLKADGGVEITVAVQEVE